MGNLLNIYDYVTGSPQTQTLSYDNLDRLHTAQAAGGAGGNGDYAAETYDYSASSGNLSSKTGVGSYTYLAQSSGCAEGALPARPHAVTTAGTTTYCYDHNGNMTRRDPSGGAVYNFQYDAENRLVSASGSATASFVYDGDGVRVKGTVGGVTTAYIGSHFEWTGSTGKKYFYAGGRLVGMRSGTGASTSR